MSRPLLLGVIGAGAFAEFVCAAAGGLPDVAVAAVTDLDPDRARRLAERHGAAVTRDVAALLDDDRVQAVVVATPPSSHAPLTLAALRAGRHVFCEKPAALTAQDADRVAQAVAADGPAYVVDHVLRYNPLLAAIVRLRGEGLLGPVQRLLFENDAADEDLPAGHWFWDDRISGGILLEHGVHFFDAAALLLGTEPTAVQAIGSGRVGGPVDTVACTVVHADGALASYLHGFSHAHRAERQLLRVDCGLGEVRIDGWIPLRARLDVWTERAADFARLPQRLDDLLAVPGYRPSGRETLVVDVHRDAAPAAVRARGTGSRAPHHVTAVLDLGWPQAKAGVYRESVRAALHDLVTCARTGRPARAGVASGRAAVQLAAAATRALHDGTTIPLDRTESPCAASC